MVPILGRYGPFFLYSYTVVLGVGILVGVGLTAHLAQQYKAANWHDAWLVSLFGALIGGRFGFVVLHWEYFGERPLTMFQFWQGGLNYYGALLVGLLTLAAYCLVRKRPFLVTITLFTPAFALLSAFGWLACWLEGCAYGRLAPLSPLTADLPDDFGVFAVRYQTQLLGIIGSSLVFALALWLWRKQSLQLTWTTFFLLSSLRVGTGFLRGDVVPTLFNLRLDVILDGFVAILSLLLLQWTRWKVISK